MPRNRMHEGNAERQPNTSFPEIFSTNAAISVLIKPGNAESMSQFLDRYSYIFSSEKSVRLFTQNRQSIFSSMYSVEAMQRALDMDFEMNDVPFGDESDSGTIIEIKKNEAQRMTRLLFSPPKDQSVSTSRKQIFESLASSPLLDTLIELKNQSYQLIDGVHMLNIYIGDDYNDRLLLDMFYSGQKYMPKESSSFSFFSSDDDDSSRPIEETVAYQVSTRVDRVYAGLESVKQLRDTIAASNDAHFVSQFHDFFQQIDVWEAQTFALLPMDKAQSDENRQKYNYEAGWELYKQIENQLLSIGVALEWAKKIRDEQWGNVTLDPNLPDGYVGGWNVEESKVGQVINSCPEDSPVLVLCGPNTSGKSYFMRTDLFIRLAAQSFMYAPVESGNIVPYDGYFFLDRASTDSENDLSAFMSEIKDKNEVFGKLHGRNRIYMDEAYSTTAPDGQARLLYATAQAIVEDGGSVVLGTHNDLFLDRLQQGGTDVWHLKTALGKDGELQRFFSLELGIGESHSIAAAKARNLSPKFIAKAGDYLQGTIEQPRIKSRAYTPIEQYTYEARAQLKDEIVSLSHLFTGDKKSSILQLFSFDPDFRISRLFTDKVIGSTTEIKGFDTADLQMLLGNMVLLNNGVTSAELLERQQMFGQLVEDRRYAKIFDLIGNMVFFDSTIHMIKQSTEIGLDEALNPFLDEKREPINYKEKEIYDIQSAFQAGLPYLLILSKHFLSVTHKEDMVNTANRNAAELIEAVLRKYHAVCSVFTHAYERQEHKENIEDDFLTNEDIDMLSNVFASDEVSTMKKIRDVRPVQMDLMEKVQGMHKQLPIMQFSNLDIEDNIDNLLQMEYHLYPGKPFEFPSEQFNGLMKNVYGLELKQRGLPRALLNLNTLVTTTTELTTFLRETDSVYLHQAANAIDAYVDNALRMIHGGESYTPSESMEQMVEHLGAASLFASYVEHEQFSPVQFNETGDVYFEQMVPLLKKSHEAVADTISVLADERVQVLTGPNGSGKTFREKNITLTALMALATGYGPMTYGTMPLFDAVVYFDRVTQKEDASYSAGAQEIEYWKQLLALIQSPKRIFGVASIDELGSTMSARYQEAFSYAMVQTFMEESQKLLLATHNHSFVQAMLAAGTPGFMPYYLKFAIENGIVTFDRTIEPGIAASFPEEVARGMGFPPRILDISQQLQ